MAMSSSSSSSSPIALETSESDDREYRYVTLPNALQVLLISDPTTDKASASMNVGVGQYSDPIPGLAHFLEHMLFMGTSKYPDENDYQAFLNTHGGNSNAYTDLEHTNYYFDVGSGSLHDALDRFAQFFVHPLLLESSIDRERLAVDSEHAKNKQSDFWRFFQLSKTLCRPDHPYSNFGSGCSETLQIENIRDELLDFYKKYYSAHRMALTVLGAEPVAELETWVSELFGDVPCHENPTKLTFPGTPYTAGELSKLVHVVPVKEHTMTLDMMFCLPEVQTLYLSKPTRYISHLLGHEGKGSILSLLKDRHWAHELSAGEARSCTDWSSFVVSIHLTEEGLKCVDRVMQVVFAYLNMLREMGPQEWVHKETSTVADFSFRFLSKRNPMDYASSVAGFMHQYPPEHILSGPYKIHKYEPDSITKCLSYLTPQNMIAMVAAKVFEESATLTEKWYGTKYAVSDFDGTLLQDLDKATIESDWMEPKLSLPERNDMIPTDFSLRCIDGAPKDQPTLLLDSETCRLWYKPDNVFDMPKVNFMANFRTAVAYDSPESTVLTALWTHVLEEHCNEFTYLASMAGLHCYFANSRTGVEIHLSGYNHKVDVLIRRVVRTIQDIPKDLTEELFQRLYRKLEEQFQSFAFSQPYQHAFYGSDLCLMDRKWTVEEKLEALQGLTKEGLIEFSSRFLSRFHLEALVHGNVSPAEAKQMTAIVLDGLRPSAPFVANLPQTRVVQLKSGTDTIYRFREFNVDNTNHATKVLYQIGPMSLATNANLALLHHLVREPAFNELRTEEQLGYIVHTSIDTTGDNIKGLLFLIQSDSYDPIHLDARVEAFLERFRGSLVRMSKEEFQSNVDAVVKNFLEKNKNLGEESTKYWNVVTNRTYLFRKYEMIAKEVAKLNKAAVLRLFDRYVSKGAPHRQKLSVQVFAGDVNEQVEDNEVLVKDVLEFKGGLPLFPLVKSVDVTPMEFERLVQSST